MKLLFIIMLIRFALEWMSKEEKGETKANDVHEPVMHPAAHQLR
jgi:hypothetical protein